MSAGTHASTGHPAGGGTAAIGVMLGDTEQEQPPDARRPAAGGPVVAHAGLAFAATSARYLTLVLPAVRGQIRGLRDRAGLIEDPDLRTVALSVLGRRGNVEGAALLATLAPAPTRAATIRAVVAFQAAYDYTDALSELASADPGARAEQLHQALALALCPSAPAVDYFLHDECGDGGFLAGLVEDCRSALGELPGHELLGPLLRGAAARIVDFQTLNRHDRDGGHVALAAWARELTPAGCALSWWEVAAAAGSSLPVHALLAASAHANCSLAQAQAIEAAYFPWTGALHSLLDSLADREEDRLAGQPSLLDPYAGPYSALAGLTGIAARARYELGELPGAAIHGSVLTAMCSYYLSAPGCGDHHGAAVAASLRTLLGGPLDAAMWMFRARRGAHALLLRPYV